MKLIEYANPAPHTIQLVGPDKKTINIPRHSKIILSDWFIRYTPGYLKVVRVIGETTAAGGAHISKPTTAAPRGHAYVKQIPVFPSQPVIAPVAIRKPEPPPPAPPPPPPQPVPPPIQTQPKPPPMERPPTKQWGDPPKPQPRPPIVGRSASGNPATFFHQAIKEGDYAISNNIGIGILSYNRLPSLMRLIDSIRRHTDLKRTTVFVSDESTNPEVKAWLNTQKDIVVVDNPTRLGVAGNSNRLMRCLSRFKYKLLMNDDVVVLKPGWDKFYFDCMVNLDMHHFCYRQNGVYGARQEDITLSTRGSHTIKTIKDKPQGSIMAFNQKAFETVGFFDERFGMYGMEHVDWSRRLSNSGIQPAGFHDVAGSEAYFAISRDESAVENRGEHLVRAKQLYGSIRQEANRTYVYPSDASHVPIVSYVIPCRNICERNESIATVVGNIRAQRFPNIEIVIAEEDCTARVNQNDVYPAKHVLSVCGSGVPFCKAAAFNLGVRNTTADHLVLHDADILVPVGYTAEVYKILQTHSGCHIGKQVLYMNRASTSAINSQYVVDTTKECERVVEYFEGGSLGARKSAYIAAGGFDENFVGYGVEDCEFFERFAAYGNSSPALFYNQRSAKMVHLWHDRSGDWHASHKKNKAYGIAVREKSFAVRSMELSAVYIKKYGR